MSSYFVNISPEATVINLFAILEVFFVHLGNRPFYSCVLSYLAMNASGAGVELALIQTSLLFSCNCQLVSTIKAVRSLSKQGQLQPHCHSEARSLSQQL